MGADNQRRESSFYDICVAVVLIHRPLCFQNHAKQLKKEIMDIKQKKTIADRVRETKLELLRSHWCVHCVCIYVH